MNDFKPNKYQSAIFDAVSDTTDQLTVMARAGTGKTTTIVEALHHVPSHTKTLLCAFNKHIQRDLEGKAPDHVDVATLHSLGFRAIRNTMRVKVDNDKTLKLALELDPDRKSFFNVKKLVSLAKNCLISDYEDLLTVAQTQTMPISDPVACAKLAHQVLGESQQQTKIIDFDDMIWLPVVLDLKPDFFKLVFVDEAQDLNPAQQWLIEHSGRRLVTVGDDRQAIYGWRGATPDLMQLDGGTMLPLPITYRCPKKVVEIANRIVPDYEAHPSAPDGIVEYRGVQEMIDQVEPGDFILSRTNAPLLRTCLQLLRQERPAVILGRDVAKRIATLLKKSKLPGSAATSQVEEFLLAYEQAERKRLLPNFEETWSEVYDILCCIRALCEGEATIGAVEAKLMRIFDDRDSTQMIVLSTVHKAKGLERDNVWLLNSTFNPYGSREEQNIYYVGVTRAKQALYFVEDEEEV